MAIKKPKNSPNFLGSTKVESLNVQKPDKSESSVVETSEYQLESTVAPARKHKDINNWGRPRNLLIKGAKEKRVSVDVPEPLLKEIKKIMKKEHKSMKELLITPAIDKYLTSNKEETA